MKTNDLSELQKLVDAKSEKADYQNNWNKNMYQHRKMVAKKNRKWLEANKNKSEFKDYIPFPDVYEKIDKLFCDDKKRKWMLHIITNFLPLNESKLVPKLPADRKECQITGFKLTDVKDIVIKDRDKHLAFTGRETTNVLCGIAVQELYRYVIDYTHKFDTQCGQIINYALDELRNKQDNKDKK
jgi:hypothetical protein